MYPSLLIALGVAILVFWFALELKSSRPDGARVKVHPYRKLLFHFLPTRVESQVTFDLEVRSEKLEAFIAQHRPTWGMTMTHATVAACAKILESNPRMNRFVSGRRLYQRHGRWITFDVKRTKMGREAKLAAVKIQIGEREHLQELCTKINSQIQVERSGKPTHADAQLMVLNFLPRPFLAFVVWLLDWANDHNILPAHLIRDDPMFTSIFLGNMGSLGMDAPSHHLFEHGNCPVFIMVGKIREIPIVEGDHLTVGRSFLIRITYDERIDDGLNAKYGIEALRTALENPEHLITTV